MPVFDLITEFCLIDRALRCIMVRNAITPRRLNNRKFVNLSRDINGCIDVVITRRMFRVDVQLLVVYTACLIGTIIDIVIQILCGRGSRTYISI